MTLLEQQLKTLHEFISFETLQYDGFSAEEVKTISALPSAIYSMELISAQLYRLENVMMPTVIAIALAARGNIGFSLLTLFLGMLSVPIGEKAYKISDKFRARQFRLGRAAKSPHYLERTNEAHIRMTDYLNAISQTEKAIIAFLLLLTWMEKNNPSNLLPQIYSIGYGLMGLNGTLSTQRNREYARDKTALAKRLIQAFNTETLILTQARWNQHVAKSPAIPEHLSNSNQDCERGLLVENFAVKIPSRNENEKLQPVSFLAKAGQTIIIRGSSGSGKSTLISGMQHVLEHSGEVATIKNGVVKDFHRLPNPQAAKELIKYFSTETTANATLINLFTPTFLALHPHWRDCYWQDTNNKEIEQDKNEEVTFRMALDTEDGLLRKEIEILALRAEKPIFSKYLSERLQEYRAAKELWLRQLLKDEGGNLDQSEITPFRGYDQLSAGQKQRITLLLAELTAQSNPAIAALVLDEPLDKLDPEINFPLQLQKILHIQNASGVPLIIITNQHLSDLQSVLTTEIVQLKRNHSVNGQHI